MRTSPDRVNRTSMAITAPSHSVRPANTSSSSTTVPSAPPLERICGTIADPAQEEDSPWIFSLGLARGFYRGVSKKILSGVGLNSNETTKVLLCELLREGFQNFLALYRDFSRIRTFLNLLHYWKYLITEISLPLSLPNSPATSAQPESPRGAATDALLVRRACSSRLE